jgi:hypothetical protein
MIDSDPDDYEEKFHRSQRITLAPGDDGSQDSRKNAGEDKMETKGAYPHLPSGRRLQGRG